MREAWPPGKTTKIDDIEISRSIECKAVWHQHEIVTQESLWRSWRTIAPNRNLHNRIVTTAYFGQISFPRTSHSNIEGSIPIADAICPKSRGERIIPPDE